MSALSGDMGVLFRTGMLRASAAMLIKLATAGLTYLTYVVLARAMLPQDYGHFAIGLSLATILAVIGGLGQQTAILRLWPAAVVAGRPDEANQALAAGFSITLAASLVLALVMAGAAIAIEIAAPVTGGTLYFAAGAPLVVALAVAEYQSAALRAQDSIWVALAPRDLVWRATLPAGVLALAAMGVALGGASALLLAALLLLMALALQALWARRRHYHLAPYANGLAAFWARHGKMSRWFLYAAAVDTIALNADTLLVGWLVDQQSAALYFNAFRTAGLMTLFTYAATLVIAPALARDYHAGDRRRMQASTAVSAWSGFGFSLLAFVVFWLFGAEILSIFGTEYAVGAPILLVLSLGLLVDAATGSVRTTMMVSGHERAYVAIAGGAIACSLALQIAMIPAFGLLGAAIVSTAGRIVFQLLLAFWCVARIGIDPSILGILRLRRPAAGEVRP